MSLPSSEPVQEVARIRVPPQACQHPFVYNQEGFCVRAGEQKGTKSVPKTFKRMNSGDLYQHLTSATSPTGNEDDDIAFYAAQLIHYGIPADWNKNRAVNTLKSLYQKRKDGPVIHVPDTITQVEKKLKKQYEDLMSRLDAANSLSETTAELEAERANLAKSQLRADKAQKKLEEAQTDVAVVKKKIKGLEALVEQRKTRLAKVEKAQQKPKPKSKTEAESDVERASLAKPEEKEGTRLAGKRNIDAIATQSSCPEKPQKKQKLVEPSVGTGGAGGNCVEVAPETPQPASCEASTNATNQAGRQMSSRKPAKQASQIAPSANPSAQCSRRELIRRASGNWEVDFKQDRSLSFRFSRQVALSKLFQKGHEDQSQDEYRYIKRYLLYFDFQNFDGYACSIAMPSYINGKLKITFVWRATTHPVFDANLVDQRKFEICLSREGLEGYLYGAPQYPDGLVFYGTYTGDLSESQKPVDWQETYDGLSARSVVKASQGNQTS